MEAKRSGAYVIDLPSNLGIVGAVQTGYIYACRENYDIVVQIDGDGQHDPYELDKLLAPVISGEVDMEIGSRFVEASGYKSPVFRNAGINFFSRVVTDITGRIIKDTTSGFRAVNKKVIDLFANYYPTDYPEVETIVYAVKKGIKIKEIPVKMKCRTQGKSSITPAKAVYYMIKVTLALILQP
jgi:glycosyltransferase involved in cell wall biosynthesis